MSLDRHMPGPHPLARRVIFGNPYHGPVQGGMLTLPTEATRSYPQPDGTWPDQAGATHLLRRPGYPAVSRTEEQELADAAAGYQWRNQAMLSGGRQQLYGENLDGWIYIDPAGERWWIRIDTDLAATAFAFISSLALDFTVQRFGEFGMGADGFTVSKSLGDWGQSGYPALTDLDSEVSFLGEAHLVLDAVLPAGSKAALCVHRRRLTSSTLGDDTVDVSVRHPVGWLQIAVESVDGLPVLTLSVLKSRGETLQVVTNTRDPYPSQTVHPALIDLGPEIGIQVGSYGFEFEFMRLVGLWADPDADVWHWLGLRLKHEGTVSTSIDTDGPVYVVPVEIAFDHWMALELDGAEKMRVATDYSIQYERRATYSPSGGGASLTLGGSAFDLSVTIDGVSYSMVGSPPSDVVYPYPSVTFVDMGVETNPGDVYDEPEAAVLSMVFKSMWRQSLRGVLVPPEPYRVKVDVCRQSPQVFTLRMHLLSGTVSEFVYWPRLTPSGLVGAKTTRPYSASERLYGSWCPHTAQALSMEASPVCWV